MNAFLLVSNLLLSVLGIFACHVTVFWVTNWYNCDFSYWMYLRSLLCWFKQSAQSLALAVYFVLFRVLNPDYDVVFDQPGIRSDFSNNTYNETAQFGFVWLLLWLPPCALGLWWASSSTDSRDDQILLNRGRRRSLQGSFAFVVHGLCPRGHHHQHLSRV